MNFLIKDINEIVVQYLDIHEYQPQLCELFKIKHDYAKYLGVDKNLLLTILCDDDMRSLIEWYSNGKYKKTELFNPKIATTNEDIDTIEFYGRFTRCDKVVYVSGVKTSYAQLNFYRWAFNSKLIKYVIKNREMLKMQMSRHVPLNFYFNRNPGLALPIVHLQYHPITIDVNFSPINDLKI